LGIPQDKRLHDRDYNIAEPPMRVHSYGLTDSRVTG